MSLQALIEKIKELREASFVEAEEYFLVLSGAVEKSGMIRRRADHTFKIDLEADDIFKLIEAAEVMRAKLEHLNNSTTLYLDPTLDQIDQICAEVKSES